MSADFYTRYANRMTPTRVKMERAGFRFISIEVKEGSMDFDTFYLRGTFECVCGKIESFMAMINGLHLSQYNFRDELLDPALHLKNFGSFSEKHLLADGYTPEQAADIVRKFNGVEHEYA